MSRPDFEDSVATPQSEDERPVLSRELPQREKPKDLPRGLQIDIRKFALEQAVHALPHIQNGIRTLDVASEFEGYIMNGRTRSE